MTIASEISNRQQDLPLINLNHVMIVGVGGIGSWVALDMALSGKCRNLYVIDPDIVEGSNLNRTPFRVCDVNFPKVDAIKYLILERRPNTIVHSFQEKTSPELIDKLCNKIFGDEDFETVKDYPFDDDMVIIDCRDDIYEDLYPFNCKYYKLGYDGLSITIDGNPRETAVWGHADGYTYVPSFVAPAQLISSLIVTDILVDHNFKEEYMGKNSDQDDFDAFGMLNTSFTVETDKIIKILHNYNLKGEKLND